MKSPKFLTLFVSCCYICEPFKLYNVWTSECDCTKFLQSNSMLFIFWVNLVQLFQALRNVSTVWTYFTQFLIQISLEIFGFLCKKPKAFVKSYSCVVIRAEFQSFADNICSLTLYFIQNNFKNIWPQVLIGYAKRLSHSEQNFDVLLSMQTTQLAWLSKFKGIVSIVKGWPWTFFLFLHVY